MIRLISSGVPPSGSASGSVPIIRSSEYEAEFRTTISGWNSIRKKRSGRAIRRARSSACWIVYSFGAISPMMLCATVISR